MEEEEIHPRDAKMRLAKEEGLTWREGIGMVLSVIYSDDRAGLPSTSTDPSLGEFALVPTPLQWDIRSSDGLI